jgi:hypothetical protein
MSIKLIKYMNSVTFRTKENIKTNTLKDMKALKKLAMHWWLAHTYNPSYSGGRDQEERGSKPAQANSTRDPISKKPHTKKDWWSSSRCRS